MFMGQPAHTAPAAPRRSHQCFRGWGNYIAIAAPSCVMVCMEWWSVECIVMLAGLLRHPSLSVAVTGICLNLMALVYMMSFGFSGEHQTQVRLTYSYMVSAS